MRKQDIASYLVSLNSLMSNQFHNSSGVTSPTLAAEYAKHWEMLRDKIKEDFSETRQSPVESDGIDKDRTAVPGNQPGSSLANRNNSGPGNRR